MKTFAILACFVLAMASATAAAQACDDGRVRTAGHCCWPGQTWSRQERVCDGAPQCPTGMSEEGETCVVRAVVPTTPPVAPTITPVVAPSAPSPTATSVETWPTTATARPDAIVDPIVSHGLDIGLVIAGAATFGVGYLLGIIGSAALDGECYAYDVTDPHHGCGQWPAALIPLGGAIPSLYFPGTRFVHYSEVAGVGVTSTVMQIVGVWLVLHAVLGYTNEISEGVAIGDAHLAFEPGAAGTQLGATARLTF